MATRAPSRELVLAELQRVARGQGGPGGRGGVGQLGADGSPGVDDDDVAGLDVAILDTFLFDAAAVEPGSHIDIVGDSGTNVISVDDLASPPELRVEELRVRSGATFGLSCDTRIIAQRVVIEEGAMLRMQGQNRSGCAFQVGAGSGAEGQRGLSLYLEAATVTIDGTIDLAGGLGLEGGPGGAGGQLTIKAESVVFGPSAQVNVAGGNGGDGIDETPC